MKTYPNAIRPFHSKLLPILSSFILGDGFICHLDRHVGAKAFAALAWSSVHQWQSVATSIVDTLHVCLHHIKRPFSGSVSVFCIVYDV